MLIIRNDSIFISNDISLKIMFYYRQKTSTAIKKTQSQPLPHQFDCNDINNNDYNENKTSSPKINQDNKLKRSHNYSNQLENIQNRLQQCSFDSTPYQIEKKFKYEPDESILNESKHTIENTSILKSLLREESSLLQQVNRKSIDKLINLDKSKNDSDTSNLSVIINEDEDEEIKKTDESSSSVHNKTFYINSDSEDENLPDGWSVNWTPDGRKYYIGNYIVFIV